MKRLPRVVRIQHSSPGGHRAVASVRTAPLRWWSSVAALRSKRRHAQVEHRTAWGPPTPSEPLGEAVGVALDALVAFVLLLVTIPVLGLLAIAVRIVHGSPVFYRGERLGRHKRPFTIYKLRTLRSGAERLIGGELLNGQIATTRLGRFLRDTRLDELPQFINVIRGDMALVGPRPERAEVYAGQCACIPSYDNRFAVRPGVFGYSQLFTPHSAPKSLRARLDNRFVRCRPGFARRMLFLAGAAIILLANFFQRCGRPLLRVRVRWGADRQEHVRVIVGEDSPSKDIHVFSIARMDDSTVEITCRNRFASSEVSFDRFTLRRSIGNNGACRRRSVSCFGDVRGVHPLADGDSRIVIAYRPASPLDQYVLSQCFLMQSIGSRHRAIRRIMLRSG